MTKAKRAPIQPAAAAAHGQQILVTVSQELAAEYGRGLSFTEMHHA